MDESTCSASIVGTTLKLWNGVLGQQVLSGKLSSCGRGYLFSEYSRDNSQVLEGGTCSASKVGTTLKFWKGLLVQQIQSGQLLSCGRSYLFSKCSQDNS